MLNSAFEILNIIEKNGFEAYIVGGYVRDTLLGITSNDIDITTNAKPSDLLKIFSDITENKYGSVRLIYNNYEYEITTYRKEIAYKNYRWPKIVYIDSLYEDLLRRDFTINTLCMDKNKNIIDLFDAQKDLENKIIKCIGDPKSKLKEDSLRILRAIRFASTLNFNIDINLLTEIKNNSNLLKHLSYDRKKDELNKIFSSNNIDFAFNLMNKLEIDKSIEIEHKNIIMYTDNVLGIWAQINFSNKYNFSNIENKIINDIRYLINKNNIDMLDVYKLNKDAVYISAQILNIDYKEIDKLYTNLPIHNKKDINITYDDIVLNFNIQKKKINSIYIDLEEKILYNKLKNEKGTILNYLKSKYEMR